MAVLAGPFFSAMLTAATDCLTAPVAGGNSCVVDDKSISESGNTEMLTQGSDKGLSFDDKLLGFRPILLMPPVP